MYRVIYLFFFLSGFTSLVFEVLWERELMHVFGTTGFALSTLLTAFMAGLALGSTLGGRVAARLRRPLRVYGLLEGSIGLYALAVPWLLSVMPEVYNLIFDSYLENFYIFSLLRFGAAFIVLVIPTTLMGATLPLVSQWVARRERLFQGKIGLLYGVNTLGACAGSLLAGFFILPAWGLSATNTFFAMTNFALCALVLLVEHFVFGASREAVEEEDEELQADLDEARGVRVTAEPLSAPMVRLVLGGFAVAGAISMCYQVLWTRAYAIILGSSTYSFTLILVGFLVGLAAGSAVVSAFVPRIRRPVFWLAASQLGVALTATLAFFLLDHLPELLFDRLRGEIGGAGDVYTFNFWLVGMVVFLPTFLQGMAFPLVVRAVVAERDDSGREVGRAYAFNTAGSIVGSFGAGFVLLPLVGLHDAIAVAVLGNLGVGVALGIAELRDHPTVRRAAALGAVAVVALGVYALAPAIDRVGLTRGIFRVYWARELFTRESFERDDPELVYYEDGLTATISVEERGRRTTLKANGKPEASDGADMATQIMVALMPFVVRSGDPDRPIGSERAAMVGYGSGVTAGAALQWPLERLEVVEIEEAMVGASHHFDHVNHEPLDDPRMELVISDGRNYLEYTDQRYDVIVSEPSNPWIAGVASLFTVEHFRRARRHLAPGGVFAQWVQLYELSPENVATVLATFLEVFPHVQAYSSKPHSTDMILLGSDEPLPFPAEGYARAWEIESVRAEMARAGVVHPHDLYGLLFMNQSELEAFARDATLNTDDNGRLEFAAPRDLILYEHGEDFFSERYDRRIFGDMRPSLEGWPDDERWTARRVGELARAAWLAGKPHLADELLRDTFLAASIAGADDIEIPEVLEQVRGVRRVQRLELGAQAVARWPMPDGEFAAMLRSIERNGYQQRALMRMVNQAEYERDGFSGEKGLLFAYLAAARGYHKDAERQLGRLHREGEQAIVDSFFFALLEGHVEEHRLDFGESWEAYLRAHRRSGV